MKEPTKEDLLAEIDRLSAENERLTRLSAAQRPELRHLRDIEVGLRDLLNYREVEEVRLKELHEQCRTLLPDNDDLPSLMELRGICGKGKERVDAALRAQKRTPSERQ